MSLFFALQAVGKTTGKAGQRHQLSSLLKDAHANRSVLEERIAAAKRNKRDSGAKYGEYDNGQQEFRGPANPIAD